MSNFNQFKYNNIPVNSLMWPNTSFPISTLPNFTYSDGTKLSGITKTNDWQQADSFENYGFIDLTKQGVFFVKSGYQPMFEQRYYTTTPGTYLLKIESGKIKVYKGSTVLFEQAKNNFRDGVLPSRLFLILQAGGGGGGATNNIYAGGANIGGANGGAGGSGACFVVCLNLDYLKESSSNYFKIDVGSGGNGAPSGDLTINGYPGLAFEGAFTGHSGNSGGSSTLWYNTTKLITAGGGGAGGSTTGYGAGSPGAGGTVTQHTGNGSYWWPVPCTMPGGVFSSSCWLDGKSGGSYQHSGSSTSTYTPRAVSKSSYYSKINMYFNLGGYSGGAAGQGEAPGGGASWFGNGGSGGGATQPGYAGGIGAGGGGGRWTATGYGTAPAISVTYAACKGGGNGGSGCMYLFY